ncbi:ASKHA domain-containing protein, partial [Hypericibacter sp.]|uniref:ASKHA domain-containing protein n=1 Tax=Hypericibacter sp. TaxID=2705401 RepID=UPI003D6C9187
EIDLQVHPNARIYVLPCIAGHVGADTAGVILSESPHMSGEMTLIVDVGTNAEIVLGNRDRLLAASSPTGPAFEGAQISGGQRAAPGAIERVRIDPETLEPKFKVIGSDKWSNEPGFFEDIALIGVTGICGSGIIEALAEMYLTGIINQDGVVDGAMAAKSPRIQPEGRTFSYLLREGEPTIRITQTDVRAIQLAKAALYAGARLLMDKLGIDKLDRITLAGAFGSHIDVKYAMILGMIPDCDLAKVTSAGNAAGTGARIALLNLKARDEIARVVKQVEKVETAVEPMFQQHFVEAMAIPHKTAPYENLAKVVTLPPHKEVAGGAEAEARRARRRRG